MTDIKQFDSRTLIDSTAQALHTDPNGIPAAIVKERAVSMGLPGELTKIEEIFRQECSEVFGESNWRDISEAHILRFTNSIYKLPIEDQKQAVIGELRRLQLAKFLQLNKFTASPEEIQVELDRLGIDPFVEN